ncbi:DUF1000-domain-containing protein [Wilcoxina mikolae CBS 423.85]|nr:DUF1000-domain-containing protein [Wilcoxina mikolae CBS 423.85]
MSSYPEITSGAQLQTLLEGPKLTIVAFYRNAHEVLDTMGAIAGRITDKVRLARCDLNRNGWAETQYQVTTDPTFLAFKNGTVVQRMSGVSELISKLPDLSKTIESSADGGSSSSDSYWLGAPITAKNYSNITSNIEIPGLDIMNANTAVGGARILFEGTKPSGLSNKGKGKGEANDWVESDTDEQLMLFVPFQAPVKLHSVQITSLPPPVDEDDDDDEAPSRPKTIKLFCNTHQILGFEEAEEREATQTVELGPNEWNKDGTAVIPTKFVKFQNCSAVTIFFLDVEREGGEKVRVDRIRVIGEVMGEKVDMAKLKQEEN